MKLLEERCNVFSRVRLENIAGISPLSSFIERCKLLGLLRLPIEEGNSLFNWFSPRERSSRLTGFPNEDIRLEEKKCELGKVPN